MRERRIVTPWRIHTSRLREDRGLFLSLTIRFTGEEVNLRSLLRSSAGNSSRCRQRISAELCGQCGWSTLCLSSWNCGRLQIGSAVVSLRTRPAASPLQTIAVVERQFSWTFPAHPRSLASVLIPRPITPATKTRRRGPRFCGPAASAFPGLLPQPDALGPHSRKCTLGTWERGTLPPHHTQIVCWGPRDLASLRARVSRG
jgi:hypothetical protein